MRLSLFLSCFILLFGKVITAQVSAYSFVQTTEVYVPVTGTVSTAIGDDGTQTAIPIGFTFTFGGAPYTTFSITTNGMIRLGGAAISLGYTNDLSNSAVLSPLIAPLWDDNNRNTGSIQYVVAGVAPNRTLEVGWDNVNVGGFGSTSATSTASFKIRLHETTNVIDMVYGGSLATAGTLSASIGLNDLTSFLSVTPAVAATASSATPDNAISSVTNLAGKKYVFTPPLPCAGAPTAGTASAPAGACSGVNFVLSLAGYTSGASGITFQWQSSSDGITYTNMAGATTANYTTSQTVATFYQCIVTCTASGASSTSNFVNVAMNPFSVCYCRSGALNTGDEDIFNVTVGSLNNTSTCATTGGAGSLINRYSNYYGVATPSLAQTEIVHFSVQVGTCGGNFTNGVAIFIDFNQNGSYADAGENVYNSAGLFSGPHTETGFITIPLTASLGITGMRVICSEDTPIDPCGPFGYGETEDYNVNIAIAPDCIQPNTLTASAITTTTGTFGWTAGASETNWDVYYGIAPLAAPTGATIPSDSTTTNSYNVTGLTSLTSYQYYVRADCGTSTSAWTGPFTFNTICGGTSCSYVFALSSLYGSWDGASIDVIQNGVLVQNVTMPAGLYTDSIYVPLCDGVATTLSWNTGLYPYECAFALYNPFNALLTQFSDGSTISEDSVFTSFTANCTPPACPQPIGLSVSNVGIDSATIAWSCPTCTGPYIIEYDTTGFTLGTGIIDTVASSPFNLTGLTQGTNYQIYVSQDCSGTGDGTSTLNGPVSFTTTVPYDNVCGALPLSFGVNGPFETSVATIQVGEPVPPAGDCAAQTGWCNFSNTITNTLWFTFVAPASGRVSVQSPDFDTQLAIWDAVSCDTILQGGATLIAANDDDPNYAADGGVMFSSFLSPVSCLTPGKTYYVQLDPYTSPGGSTTIVLTALGVADASFTTLNPNYCSLDSAVTLVPVEAGGVFTGAGVTGSTFDPSTAGMGTHTIVYHLSSCDSTVQTVAVENVPVAAYTYSNVANVITFTNTSTSGTSNSWNFGDGSAVSTVTNPVHTFTANGAYTVQLIVTGSCGADTVSYTLVITGIGIDELTAGSVSVYPNPTSGLFHVTVNNAVFSQLTISVIDLQGKEIFSTMDKNITSGYIKQINLEGISKGIYYIRLNTGTDMKVQKLIIQ